MLFLQKREFANDLIEKLPPLRSDIANSTLTALYEEFRECFVLGMPGASITLAIILLDISAKYRIHEERIKKNPKASWTPIEDMLLKEIINELFEHEAITKREKINLLAFNRMVRNNYLHYNIQKLVKDMIIAELPSLNVITGEVMIENNIKAAKRPALWFSAKKVLDRETVLDKVSFCIYWVNKLSR